MATVIIAAPAKAATNVYPGGDSTHFNTSDGGWAFSTSSEGLCIPSVTCPQPTGEYLKPGDNGFIRINFGSLLGAAATTVATYTSPAFEFNKKDKTHIVFGSRNNLSDFLSATGNNAELTVEIIKGGDVVDRPIENRELISNSNWTRTMVTVNDNMLTNGSDYRIHLVIRFESGIEALPSGYIDFDNIALATSDSSSNNGNDGNNGNSGGIVVNKFTTNQYRQFAAKTVTTLGNRVAYRNGFIHVKTRCPKRIDGPCRYWFTAVKKKGKMAKANRVSKTRFIQARSNGRNKQVKILVKPGQRKYVLKKNYGTSRRSL